MIYEHTLFRRNMAISSSDSMRSSSQTRNGFSAADGASAAVFNNGGRLRGGSMPPEDFNGEFTSTGDQYLIFNISQI